MSSSSRSAAAAFYFVGHVVNFVVSFLAVPYLARSLSQHDFGVYGQVLMVWEACMLLFNFGLNNSMALALTEQNRANDRSLFSTFTVLIGLMGMACSVFIFLFSYFAPYLFGHTAIMPLLRWASIFALLFFLNNAISRCLIYLNRSKYYVIGNVLGNILRVLIMFIAIHFYHSLWGAIMGVGVGIILQLIIGIWGIPRSFFKGEVQTSQFVPILREGYLLSITYQIQYAYLYLTGVVISYYLGVEQYAIYRNSSFEIPLVGTLYMAINTIMFPSLASQVQQGNYEAVLAFKQRIIKQIAILIYPIIIFMAVFSPCFIELYLSEKYAIGAPVFAIISLSLLTKVSDFGDMMAMQKDYKGILRVNLWYFAVFLLLLFTLMNFLGIVGAALAVSLSAYFMCYLYINQILKHTQWTIDKLLNFRHLAAIIALSTVLSFLFRGFNNYLGHTLISFLSSGILYALVLYGIALRLGWIDLQLYEPIFKKTKITQYLYQQLRRVSLV